MGDLLQSILSAAVLIFVVGPLTGWIMRAMAKQRAAATDDLERFRVEMPRMLRIVIAGCGVVFELVLQGVYVWQGVSLGEWDAQFMWFGHGMALVCLALWAFLGMKRLDVDGDALAYRGMTGRRGTTTFDRITRATIDVHMGTIVLYQGDECFASVDMQCTCVDNLLARLAEADIPVGDAVGGYASKRALAWTAIKPLAIVMMGIAAVASFVLLVIWIADGKGLEGLAMLALIPFLFVAIGVVLPGLLFLALPMRGLRMIACQERELGFSFDEQMRACDIHGTSAETDEWFIDISNAQVIAFRRDYIKSVTKPASTANGDECKLTSKGGKVHKVRGASPTLEELRRWFKEGPREDEDWSERIDEALDAAGAL